jgi:hypothetical protein
MAVCGRRMVWLKLHCGCGQLRSSSATGSTKCVALRPAEKDNFDFMAGSRIPVSNPQYPCGHWFRTRDNIEVLRATTAINSVFRDVALLTELNLRVCLGRTCNVFRLAVFQFYFHTEMVLIYKKSINLLSRPMKLSHTPVSRRVVLIDAGF